MTWQTFAFLPLALAAFGYAGYRISVLIKLMKAHQGKGPSIQDIPARVGATIANVLGQKAVLEKKAAGIMHATIFWGFIIITIGTTEQFISTVYSGFTFEFVGKGLYSVFSFLHDLFTVLVILAVAYACYRRFVLRPEGLGKSTDANIILLVTGSLMISILLMNGFHFLHEDVWFAAAMPFSRAVASALAQMGFADGEAAGALGLFFKWVHMLLVLGFTVYIPGSKHLHVLAAGPNTFLKNLDRPKAMSSIDFEDESLEQYGAAKVTDMSWKDALDYYSCTECGRCQDLCPAWNTQKPLSPKLLVMDLRNNLFRNEKAIRDGKIEEVTPAIDDNVTEDVIWACTSCRACEIACPVFINHTDKIYDIRRNLVMMESKFPTEVQTVFKNMETNATPWAFSAADRANWADGLEIKTVEEQPDMDVLLWVGCAGSFDDRNQKVLRSFVNILKKAGVKFSILGNEEQCTGDPARRIGNEYLFQTMAQANVETLNRHSIQRVVTACPHCFNTLKNEYKDFGGEYEVFHHSEFIAQLIREGRIKPTKSLDETVTFHDSCYLGRWNDVYNEPREILDSIPAVRPVEMKSNHDQSMCCGAGGGRLFMEETIGKRINITRTEQALETQAGVIAAGCPFCMTMMSDGVKEKNMHDKVQVKDLAELIDDATP